MVLGRTCATNFLEGGRQEQTPGAANHVIVMHEDSKQHLADSADMARKTVLQADKL
jgi:hypothetical protein